MKIIIASDLHGSEYYCKKLLDTFKRDKADKILFLGDILYHGPRNDLPKDYNPKGVIELLNQIKDKILCVRGNCDTEVDQMVLSFSVMADYSLICIDDTVIYASHGHKYNPDNLPPMNEGEVFVSGHTHIPLDITVNGIRCLNPGSLAIPKENSKHGYILFEKGEFIFKEL